MNCSRSLRVGFALAASFTCAVLRSFGSGGVFIDYPGNTAGLTTTVVHQTPGLNATVDSFSTASNDGDWKLAFGGVDYENVQTLDLSVLRSKGVTFTLLVGTATRRIDPWFARRAASPREREA